MQGGSSSSPYVTEGSEAFQKFSERMRLQALEPSADYASRYVRPRTIPHSEPIINYNRLCSNGSKICIRPPNIAGSALKNLGLKRPTKMAGGGFGLGVVTEAMADAGIDPQITGATFFAGSTALAYRYGPKGAVKGNVIGFVGGMGAGGLADAMGGSAEQSEAASEFGGFASGFAAGPHVGVAGGFMQVGTLAGRTAYEMGAGTARYGTDYWSSWWNTGYFRSFQKCYCGR